MANHLPNTPYNGHSTRQTPSSSSKRLSASGLLSVFKARQSPTSASRTRMSQVKSPLAHGTMANTSSEDPFTEEQTHGLGVPASVIPIKPEIAAKTDPDINAEEEDDDDDTLSNIDVATPAFVATPAKVENLTPTRSLPPRSTRSKVSYALPAKPSTPKSASSSASTKYRTKKQRTAALVANRILDSDMEPRDQLPPPRVLKTATERNRVREEIATKTKAKRDAFLLHHKEYFLPLLPENNHISKIIQADGGEDQEIVPHTPLDKQPENVKATMKPYQLTGLSFLVNMYQNAMPAILGDEMGLGKTLQTLSLIQYLEENHPSSADFARPYLVVCPLSVLGSWYEEARKWTPNLRVIRFHGAVAERTQIKSVAHGKTDRFGNNLERTRKKKGSSTGRTINQYDGTASFDIMVTTYEAFQAEQTWLKQAFVWRYCILDEGHKIKNDQTNISLALQGLRAEHRLLLTGTPLQNDMREMWSLLHWLYPDVFTDKTSEVFKQAFDLGKGQVDSSFMDHARHLLELIMIRRMKNSPGVDLGLPPKKEILLYVPLTPVQRFWYKRMLTRAGDNLLDELFGDIKQKEHKALIEDVDEDAQLSKTEAVVDAENDFTVQSRTIIEQAIANEASGEKDTSAYKKLMNLVMQLRKACIHPYMIKGAAPEPYMLGDHIMHASGKFIVLSKLVDELVMKQGKKILIFSGFTRTLDYCEDLLMTKGSNQHDAPFRHVRLDGSTQRAMRNLQIRMFNDPSSEFKIMLISTRAGGLGLNLTSASDVIFLDEDWNPQVTLQAEARSHRIGQTKPVTIYKLCTQGTVEEQMMGRIRKKLYLSAKITESMEDIHSIPEQSNANQSLKRKRASRQGEQESVANDGPDLGTSQLMSLIRRGATTLTHPEINVSEMVNWDLETIIEKCKDKPVDPHVSNQSGAPDEKEWLAKMERVECAVLDGIKYQRQRGYEAAPVQDLVREDRRAGKNTTVMVDGFAINKESLGCAEWEAVPTLAGKDPRLAEPVREKAAAVEHQSDCQICFDGGEIYLCSSCPRSYHLDCLPPDYQAKAKSKMSFVCPQHNCTVCERNTSNAGGLIYRCRWCHRGYCEDCLDFENSKLLGETLPEYDLLGYVTKKNAWYIHCATCLEMEAGNPETKKFFVKQTKRYEKLYQAFLEQQDGDMEIMEIDIAGGVEPPSRAESMTVTTTLQSSRQITPQELGTTRRMTVVDLISDEDMEDDVVETHPPPFDDQAEGGAQRYIKGAKKSRMK